MKARKYIPAALGLLTACTLLTSCVQNDYYNTEPNNNNNHHNSGYQNEFYDDFSSDRYGWSFGSPQDSAYANVQSGQLTFVNYATSGLHTAIINTGGNFNYDFQVSANVKSDNKMGIIFGASNSDYGYSFIVKNDSFEIYKEGSASLAATPITSGPWQYSSAINRNGWNTLKVEQVNNFWSFTINGTQVYQVGAYPVSGSQCGFILLPVTSGNADDLDVKW